MLHGSIQPDMLTYRTVHRNEGKRSGKRREIALRCHMARKALTVSAEALIVKLCKEVDDE